ncbi:hypothetical protein OSB04_016766 [Centaurea solstitialis]|uniref:Integrase catalytic domain-containing protein n=1 Tax=Centaurea solstitialis TaxID=347529 RepID=A0AA38TET8_9ASTR|nr:hypothetical protein OSB04_016766 [Centaurea solstitialis]
MNQVSYVDGLKHNLISVSQLCDNGMDVMFKIKYCIMYKPDTLIEVMRANRRGELYLLCFEALEAKEEICLVSSTKSEEAWLWHTRFCQLNFHTLDKLVRLKLVKGQPDIKFEKDHVRVLRSENGTEFKKSIIEEYLASVGITHNFLAPRTPQQNGVVEKINRTLVEAARMMLDASKLPLTFWAEVVSAACYTQNKYLVVKRFEKTLYQLLHNKRPNVKFFHIFGCKCYVLNDREPIGKFDPKGDDAIFIGYSWDFAAYRVYVPRSQIFVVSTNVKFDDNFQVTRDKFTEELKIQAEKSPNATIPQDIEIVFNEWFEDDADPERASEDVPKASAKASPLQEASPFVHNHFWTFNLRYTSTSFILIKICSNQ